MKLPKKSEHFYEGKRNVKCSGETGQTERRTEDEKSKGKKEKEKYNLNGKKTPGKRFIVIESSDYH